VLASAPSSPIGSSRSVTRMRAHARQVGRIPSPSQPRLPTYISITYNFYHFPFRFRHGRKCACVHV
jgi:hypothetical protein